MLELKEKPVCCGKPMKYDNCNQSLIHSVNAEIQQWTCLECGRFINLVDDQVDEEELEYLRTTYSD